MSPVATEHPTAEIDRFLPEWRWHERHELAIAAPPKDVDAALRQMRAADLPLASLLMAVRMLPARLRGRVSRRGGRPVLEEFMAGGFVMLADVPAQELVFGLVARPWRLGEVARRVDPDGFLGFTDPGFVRVATNFRFLPRDDRTLLETETRIQPTDTAAARAFGRYWLVVHPGSALIRHEWLRAVRRRAQASATMAG